MPHPHSLGYRQLHGLHKPPSALSKALASILRDVLGILILLFVVLFPIFITNRLNP